MHCIITDRMMSMQNENEALQLARFFRTGKGQYGEGDKFLGIKVPETRKLIKEYKGGISHENITHLITSRWHEIRLAGFLLLISLFEKNRNDEKERRRIVLYYLDNIRYGNNWDLVDLVAPKILGAWLVDHPDDRKILHDLASADKSLWHNRVAIVSTWSLIRNGEYSYTYSLVMKLLNHPHDLIHKACGWMLREAGKRGDLIGLKDFLDVNASRMPRTMLRYAIEKFPDTERRRYLALRPEE